MPKFDRFLFELVVVLAVGLIGFMALSAYNMHVIDQQSTQIKLLQQECK